MNNGVYVAARYMRKNEVADIAKQLRDVGIVVTSTWHEEPYAPEIQLSDATPAEHREFAERDLRELDAADVLLLLSESPTKPYVRGGRLVEFGYAVKGNKTVLVLGPEENVFSYLPTVRMFKTLNDLLLWLVADPITPSIERLANATIRSVRERAQASGKHPAGSIEGENETEQWLKAARHALVAGRASLPCKNDPACSCGTCEELTDAIYHLSQVMMKLGVTKKWAPFDGPEEAGANALVRCAQGLYLRELARGRESRDHLVAKS